MGTSLPLFGKLPRNAMWQSCELTADKSEAGFDVAKMLATTGASPAKSSDQFPLRRVTSNCEP
jgi:hypothetical protein